MTTNHTKCNQKQPEVSTFCNLTEQWKKGELEEGVYYVRNEYDVVFVAENYINYDCFNDTKACDFYNVETNIKEVLAPVPSYEEWQEKQKSLKVLAEAYCKEKEENQQLKTQIAKLTEIVGVLPSNHSVGNLGYKIKNQRHEINNRLKEIDKLKELLKECKEIFSRTAYTHKFDMVAKIDNAIGEKK